VARWLSGVRDKQRMITRMDKRLVLAFVRAVLALSVVPATQQAQAPIADPDSPLVAALARSVAAGNSAAADQFWRTVANRGTPLIDSLPGDTTRVLATFLFRGRSDTRDVVLVAGQNGIAPFEDPRSHMRHLGGTDVWYVSHRLARDAEFFYQISVNPPVTEGPPQPALLRQTMTADPLNPLRYPEATPALASAGFGSIARVPAVPANPWLAVRPGVAAGVVRADSIASDILHGVRRVWTYASPGASLTDARLLIMFDGAIYVNRIPTPTILDNLYAEHRIGPTVAVFVDNGGAARATDYYLSDAFTGFLVRELLPWLQRRYALKLDRARTVVGGSSLGGLTAVYSALRRPDVFGAALSQSGSFWVNGHGADREPEWLARELARTPRSNTFFYLDVGTNESTIALETTLLASNRHLRDILQLTDRRYSYVEVPGDHEPVHWRRTLPDALMATLGR